METENNQNILLVTEKMREADFLQNLLCAENYSVSTALTGKRAIEMTSQKAFPVFVSDLVLNDIAGCELLKSIKLSSSETQLIFISEKDKIDLAVETMKMGAFGFVLRPVFPPHLLQVLNRAKIHYDSLIENKRLRAEIKGLTIQSADGQRAFHSLSLKETERDLILRTLHECRGNKHLAAKRLKIPRSSLYSKIQKHGIRTDEKDFFYSRDKRDISVLIQDIPA